MLPRLKIYLLAASLVFFSCTALPPGIQNPGVSPPPAAGRPLDTSPAGDMLVFYGFSEILSNREDAVQRALEDAARRVAMYKAVEGRCVIYMQEGGGLFDQAMEESFALGYNQDYRGLVGELDFEPLRDVFEGNRAVIVRARYPAPVKVTFRPLSSGTGRPSWIDNPPSEIAGHLTGVGYAKPHAFYGDTVNASGERALFSIIKNLSGNVWSVDSQYQGSGHLDFGIAVRHGMSARAVLTGFYILETWEDPADRSIWTLAIIREGQVMPVN